MNDHKQMSANKREKTLIINVFIILIEQCFL